MKEKSLSKYDVLYSKAFDFKKLGLSVMEKSISLTDMSEEVVEQIFDGFLIDAHIIYQIRKDIVSYLKMTDKDKVNIDKSELFDFMHNIVSIASECDKFLLLNILFKNYKEVYLKTYKLFINNENEGMKYYDNIFLKLSDKDKELLNSMINNKYRHNELPSEYLQKLEQSNKEFMNQNIMSLVNKEEEKEVELEKAMKILYEKIGANLSVSPVLLNPDYDIEEFIGLPKSR